ncbi:DUF5677 domain-containing protein [Streptomyces sp. UNOB3_S3]|uniref:DUF5677 domain-containing protein n=1 Tax=Streptomyces sp. UNOB3_S3 TaxID=2871682 RepID=UPI001E56A2E6|nr:DUF5677 domain-containing protein [Streptomyces sp. UNOB3_S3]MCC3776069.1 hypothetical protein [Streptomyces sp. UNOB3_S3]
MLADGTITSPKEMDRESVFQLALDKVLEKVGDIDPVVRGSVKWSLKYGAKRRARVALHNERSILKKLGKGFRDLSNAVTVADDVNRDLFVDFAEWVAAEKDSHDSIIGAPDMIGGPTLHVLTMLGLHARGCSMVSEIDLLARKGLIEAASARARSLYELMTITSFLSVRNTPPYELTERYHLSAVVERRKDALFMGEEDPFASMSGLEDIIRTVWGPEFFRPYGWALPGVPGARPGRVTFRDIERAAVLDHMRHAYLTMNHAVHSGAMAITTRFDGRDPFRYRIGSEVDYYSTAWVAGATARFFFFLNHLAIREIASLVNQDAALMLGPLISLCESAEQFFEDCHVAHAPSV